MSTEVSPEMQQLKGRLKATWEAGDFGVIAKMIDKGGDEFIDRLNIKPGMKVLDVACGTGNLALPAARAGGDVTGIDIAANLIDQARSNAEKMGVSAKFEVGDAEDLPYEDGSFDVVVTMFGAMFAPRPEVTAAELKRVCRSGGTIAMANWTPEAFTGQMFKTGGKHVPPPPGMPSPLMWGTEERVRELFADGISDLQLERRKIVFEFDGGPEEIVECFRQYFGPTNKAFGSLDESGQAALRADLVQLWTDNNQATDGSIKVESEYLAVTATRS